MMWNPTMPPRIAKDDAPALHKGMARDVLTDATYRRREAYFRSRVVELPSGELGVALIDADSGEAILLSADAAGALIGDLAQNATLMEILRQEGR